MRENPGGASFLSVIRSITELDAEQAIDALGGSEQLYKMTLQQFMRLLPSHIDAMDSSLAAGNLDSFAITAHGVKGSMRQLGSRRIAKAAEALELAAKANDAGYCHNSYGAFKDTLLRFYACVNDALEILGEGAATPDKTGGDIRDYAGALAEVRAALEDYDSLLASELLAPLTKIGFGDETDDSLSGAAAALESFQPESALEYIKDIIGKLPL